MDFNEAVDRLTGRVSQEDLAAELGASLHAVRQARLAPSFTGHRRPPEGWERAAAALARRRARELEDLASALEGAGE